MKIIIELIVVWIINLISKLGLGGIVLLMGLESANIPIPSEVILPFAGFLVWQGKMNFHLAALAGALGCLGGSIFSYYLGVYLGRPLTVKYGKYFLISEEDLNLADRWIAKYGDAVFFFSRLLPVVRTFISLGGGITKARFWHFSFYTFIGSWLWSYLLIYLGVRLGEHWIEIRVVWEKFDFLIIGLGIILVVWYIRRHVKKINKNSVVS
ncbi:MAG: DedA family protein [Candidatus Buchananbacteria bacterium]